MSEKMKRYNFRIVDRETAEVKNVELEGYALLGVAEEDTEMLAASILAGNVGVVQLARLIDCLVQKEPTILQAFAALSAINEPTQVLEGLDMERTKAVMEEMRHSDYLSLTTDKEDE